MPISKTGKGEKERKRKKIVEGGLRKTDADKDIGRQSIAVAEAKKSKKEKSDAPKKTKNQKNVKVKEPVEEALDLPNFDEKDSDGEEEEQNNGESKELPSVNEDNILKKGVEESQQVELSMENSSSKPFLSVVGGPKDDDNEPKVPSYSYRKNRGVVYVSHVPHGFYEKQMREFFTQFGSVTNLRLGRSKKTGKSCGYAFVEFKYMEVAKVVSETMNNYLMFDKILKCVQVPAERCSPAMFKGKVKPSRPPGRQARFEAKKMHNSEKCAATTQKRQVRQIKKVKKTMDKLKEAGIEYSFKIAEMSTPPA